MCHFITLIAESDDADMLDAAMRTHGRCAQPIDNASLRAVLKPGERQYLTAAKGCDCGTVLTSGPGRTADEIAEERNRQRARLVKKGWSAGKIDRWFEDTDRAAARAIAGCDSIELWVDVLRDLISSRGLKAAGLFVHGYAGGLETEIFEPRRIDVHLSDDLGERLSSLKEDELLMVMRA